VVVALVLAAGLLVVLAGAGCGTSGNCGGCVEGALATFNLSCSPNDLVSVLASGPCAMPDAGLAWYTGVGSEWSVGVGSPSPGECHVVLTFATGFTYSADVTFTSQTAESCKGCPPYIGPTSGPFTVNNPATTCLDAAPDAAPEAGSVTDASPGDAAATTSDAALPACSWPASFDMIDGSSAACSAARGAIRCTGMGIGFASMECESDDLNQCAMAAGMACPSCGPLTCSLVCGPDEYVLDCSAGGEEGPNPPSTCRIIGATVTTLGASYCCPCGPPDVDDAGDGGAPDSPPDAAIMDAADSGVE
jgi:hypothetical protein